MVKRIQRKKTQVSKYLIIVESPNKVRHIQEFVGSQYRVMASVGHIRQINDSGKYKIGVDYDDNFKTDYIVDPKKKDVVKELKSAVKDAEIVYLASDDDSEGEAIAWHLKDTLKIPASKLKRAIFKEITKKSVLEGLANASTINENKASAALARAKLDKIMGYRMSPIVLSKMGGKSAGRVQSVALKIVCEREKEIKAFVPEEYYELFLHFEKDGKEYKAQLKGTTKKKFNSVKTKDQADQIKSSCLPGEYYVDSITNKDRKVQPKLPFITSSLQQECSNKFGYAPKKTMQYAQSLFEKGLITYLRTDSTRMSDEFISAAKEFIISNYGKEMYSGVRENKKKPTGNVQDAHEAIRCVDVNNTPEVVKQMGELNLQELKVYKLIYSRCVASLMTDAIITDTTISIKNFDYLFGITGHKTKYAGYLSVYDDSDEEKESIPKMTDTEKVNDKKLEVVKKSTNPPSRYSEASLIHKLEELKIGRPSTYASMASVITDTKRGYTTVEGKTIVPTEKGMRVNDFIEKFFDGVINYTYTANLEEKLDSVSNGEYSELKLLTDFYSELKPLLKTASMSESQKPKPEKVDKYCPKCNKQLLLRVGQSGNFLACSGFPRCRYTEKIVNEEKLTPTIVVPCPSCGKGYMVERKASKGKSKGKSFYGCNRYPDCKTAMTEDEFKRKLLEIAEDINPLAMDKE